MTARLGSALVTVAAAGLVYGCMAGGAEADPEAYEGELNCEVTSIDSPTAHPCRADCFRACGFNASPNFPRAVKYCECEGGVYIECRCPRPEWYQGAAFAPYCDGLTEDGSGFIGRLQNRPCETEWQQCVARDLVGGNTPRGCACLNKRGAELVWVCSSTEKWFAPEE